MELEAIVQGLCIACLYEEDLDNAGLCAGCNPLDEATRVALLNLLNNPYKLNINEVKASGEQQL
jgi:hypothetical protein